MKKFNLPDYYQSNIINQIRQTREKHDPRKKDINPSRIKLGNTEFYIGRHFGFCYGVKNAIEICYEAIEKNPNKKIYLLSQMIHNQVVNQDLSENGISFIMDTEGQLLIDWDDINQNDIVIIPAFGTSLEVLKILEQKKINTEQYNTTCPFVSKVWNRSYDIAQKGYTIIIHGKFNHEETRSTFSRTKKYGHSLIVENIKDVKNLCLFIKNKRDPDLFKKDFKDKFSFGFSYKNHLKKIGVVNQTTMLASETKEIIDILTKTYKEKYGSENINKHIANTRDTLCYATNENQESTIKLLEQKGDIAIVIGGYNSSNTNHLAELSQKKIKTFFINSSKKIFLNNSIKHFEIKNQSEILTKNFLPNKKNTILLISGASCPDSVMEDIILKIISINSNKVEIQKAINDFKIEYI